MHLFDFFTLNAVFWLFDVPAALAVTWTIVSAIALQVLPLGTKRPLWLTWHPLALMYNPKSDEHTARPGYAETLVALVTSVFASVIVVLVLLVGLRTWLVARLGPPPSKKPS